MVNVVLVLLVDQLESVLEKDGLSLVNCHECGQVETPIGYLDPNQFADNFVNDSLGLRVCHFFDSALLRMPLLWLLLNRCRFHHFNNYIINIINKQF